MSVDYAAMKQRTKAMWSLGDYSPLARLLEPAARDVVDGCSVSAGHEVLDVAAGTGNVAIAAARRGARVVASDLTTALIDVGRMRTRSEGMNIEWVEADAEDLPFENDRFDTVVSVFGAMFTPRPDVTASEMFRVLAPGGTVGMANWTTDSFARRMNDIVAKYSPPPPPGVPSPFAWGDERTVDSRFAGAAASVDCERRTLTWEFESVDAMRSMFEGHGGAVMAKRMLPPDDYQRQGKEIEALALRLNEATGGRVCIRNEYLLVVARKA